QRASDAADDRAPVAHEAAETHRTPREDGGGAWQHDAFEPSPSAARDDSFQAPDPAPRAPQSNGADSSRYEAEPPAQREREPERDFSDRTSDDRYGSNEPAAAPSAEAERS